MSRVERKLAKRISKGKLPLAYDLYNQTDVNDLSTAITAPAIYVGIGSEPCSYSR